MKSQDILKIYLNEFEKKLKRNRSNIGKNVIPTQTLLYLKYFQQIIQSFEIYPKIQHFDSSRRALQKIYYSIYLSGTIHYALG